VSWKNIVTLQDRVRKSFEAINKLGETAQCQITVEFFEMRLEELQLAHEFAEKVQADKEDQRQLREQRREEEKAALELEREKDDAEREEERYQGLLEKARLEVERANDAQTRGFGHEDCKARISARTSKERKQRAISQAEMTRLGHVYILSNEGAFGPNVFKIGMTRRLEPMDRVEELGSASVPFQFDVHAIIRSDDAPGLEQRLHQALEPHRVNLVNFRKEYFRVPLEKIIDLVTQHHSKFDFHQTADAGDFRKTLAIRAEREAMIFGKAAHASALSRVDEVKARFEQLKKATA
jgi:hypothetical protein